MPVLIRGLDNINPNDTAMIEKEMAKLKNTDQVLI